MSFYVVATPIGNLKDITLRAIETLQRVDYIVSEKPSTTRKLLSHYNIHKKVLLFSYNKQEDFLKRLYQDLRKGKEIALVCEAGTPLISDPGSRLLSFLWSMNVKIVPVPGVSALTTALSICPFDVSRFLFLGFLPKKRKRNEWLERIKNTSEAIVIFESPHRLKKTIEQLFQVIGERRIFVAREMTKFYEEFLILDRKGWKKSLEDLKIKGEFTLILEPKQ